MPPLQNMASGKATTANMTLPTLEKAARALGKRIKLDLNNLHAFGCLLEMPLPRAELRLS